MFEIIIYGYLYVFAIISVLLFVFNLKRMILSFVIMILIFWIEFLTIYESMLEELGEGFVILIMIAADLLSKGNPARQLLLFSVCGIAALIIGMMTNGLISVYAFISVGLFCSTLWPCIFTLAITGLGKFTNQGSSLLIMMIMGGGLVSALQGVLADDKFLGIRMSYTVGVVCFAYLLYYGITAGRILKKQGEVLKTSTTH